VHVELPEALLQKVIVHRGRFISEMLGLVLVDGRNRGVTCAAMQNVRTISSWGVVDVVRVPDG